MDDNKMIKFRECQAALTVAMGKLLDAWMGLENNQDLIACTKYPFPNSLDDVYADTIQWCDKTSELAGRKTL